MIVSNSHWQVKKWSTAAIHISVWTVIILFNYIFDYDDNRVSPFRSLNALTNVFRAGIFYLNAMFLVPMLLYNKKYLFYFLSLVALFFIMMLFRGALFPLFIERKINLLISSFHNIIAFVITITASIAYKTITDKAREDALASEKQQENLKTEVSFLRSQISPHFIFNVLNNIVALVRMNSRELEPTVMKLSTLMQYMLYETDKKVFLHEETQYLHDYIDLQEQRFGDFIKITSTFDVPSTPFIIEPMLLISFVENAFKHGVGLIQDPLITIELHCNNNKLYFNVQNKYNEEDNEPKDKTSGIGLSNVRRRLSLLYPEKHNLVIRKSEGYFYISLELELEYA
ncbi:sensor histidine kinase [Daejeonella sp.]|uniref:sensor histidine kinase n=1 Tax=Daejeonella sp. TaxID=2805397 RepID=UPI003983A299